MSYTLYIHKDFKKRCEQPDIFSRKDYIEWILLQLAIEGRSPRVKGTTGHSVKWRRTPIKGCHYYLWWIPNGASGFPQDSLDELGQLVIFVRDIRHHDQTSEELSIGEIEDYVFDERETRQINPITSEQAIIEDINEFDHQFFVKIVKGIP